MLKAVLFDLDGVLVDSEDISTKASDKILSEFGIVQTPEEKKKVFGRRTIDNYRDAIKARGLDLDPKALVARKNEVFAQMIRGNLTPMPGVMRFLSELKDAKVKVAVVSSSPLERVNATLEEIGLILSFDVVVSGDCCKRGKPDPQPFLIAARRLGIKPKDCVVVEDAEAGILAGKAAGMGVIAVRSPNTHSQDLSKADRIVDSIENISLDYISRL
jgi:beta-phosphoglucomutase